MKFFGSLPRNGRFCKEIDGILDTIKENPQTGNRIQHERIPKCYIAAYDVPNLFRVQLGKGWRLAYFLAGKDGQRTVYVLEAFDHKEYERRFGY